MNESESSSPESPAKEQPGEQTLLRRARDRLNAYLQNGARGITLADTVDLLNCIDRVLQQAQSPSVINWTTEGCPTHNGQSWTMGVTTVYTQIAKRCPLCEPPPPERP